MLWQFFANRDTFFDFLSVTIANRSIAGFSVIVKARPTYDRLLEQDNSRRASKCSIIRFVSIGVGKYFEKLLR